jgi:putative FmdB family regulatory protein
MPTYEYACTACANQWEEIQKISEAALDTCPKCGEKTAKRQISGGNFILKGGGWYADLYSSSSNSNKKSGGDKSSGEKSSGDAPAAKSETTTSPKTETKSAASTASSSGSSGSSGSGSSTPSKT